MTVKMSDSDYRHFLDLLMCSDPWPVPDEASQPAMLDMADREATIRGFANWVEAYHGFKEERSRQ